MKRLSGVASMERMLGCTVAEARTGDLNMLTGALLWYIGVPIPLLILIWFFFFRGR